MQDGICCAQGQDASGTLHLLALINQQLFGKGLEFSYLPKTWYLQLFPHGVGGHSSLPVAAQREQHLPPAVEVVSAGASLPGPTAAAFHCMCCGGLAQTKVMCCAPAVPHSPEWGNLITDSFKYCLK